MTGQSPSMDSLENLIVVSNGSEIFRIPSDDVPAAQADGFYRPQDRGLAIVSDGESSFEIPSNELEWAEANGFRDLLKATSRTSSFQADPASPGVVSPNASPDNVESIREGLQNLTERSMLDAEQEQEQLLGDSEGWRRNWLQLRFWFRARRAKLSRQLGGAGISILVHVAIVLLLASFVFIESQPEVLGLVASASSSEDLIDDVVIDVTPIDVAEPTEVTEPETQPEAIEVPMELADVMPDLSGQIVGEAIKPPAKPVAKFMEKPIKPTVFGSKMAATNYVFVIDNSNSMTKGRFETALQQLVLTINKLTPKQRFYVIFYSDTAYPMMHPNAVLKLVNATDRNKQALYQWLQTVPLCQMTSGMKAIGAAFQLEPDVIFVLGDGAFTDKAAQFYTARPHPEIIVHTRGMEVKPKDAVQFKKLANAHRGTYKDVVVLPEGFQMAKQYPRPRNKVRGPIWGLTLPLTAKKKK